MVWGVRLFSFHYSSMLTALLKWFVASIFILFVGMSMGELASAAPTSGGVRLIPVCYQYSFADHLPAILLDTFALFRSVSQHPCLDRWLYVGHTPNHFNTHYPATDSNTIGSIAAIASIDWGCAVQIMAAARIGSKDQSFDPTNAQLLYVLPVLLD